MFKKIQEFIQSQIIKSNLNRIIKKHKNQKILVYGAGKFAREFFENYNLDSLNIIGVADMKYESEEKPMEFYGYKTISPFDIPEVDFDIILITLLKKEIAEELLELVVIPKMNKNFQVESII